MMERLSVEQCRSFIDCQTRTDASTGLHLAAQEEKPVITISRLTGSGGLAVAEHLARMLDAEDPKAACHWQVFDRNLVEKVLEDHHLPRRLAQFMSEDRVLAVEDMMEELLGLHPASWTMIRQTTETILRLAELGRVILVGRGANVITGKTGSALHVRLIGSLESRIGRVQAAHGLGRAEAEHFIRKEDVGRARYLKQYFGKDIDDPLLYHLIINTDPFSCEQVARVILGLARERFPATLGVSQGREGTWVA